MDDLGWLDAIEARLAAATPGPWHNNSVDWLEIWANRDAAGWDAFFIATLRTDLNPDPGIRAAHDASFIAHAPEDVARLVSALRDAHAKIARVEATLERTGCQFPDGPRWTCRTALKHKRDWCMHCLLSDALAG